ncbi:coiled-coil domain-containing protein SCD2 [Cinnamomum micranthum f. kanehirae]|uniref:Coiled-coil domain-containing protein SCD2 n=1 Tax=Cinnamomum micranthum f. kanehirae TaxID=337451 RepID=A0A443PTK7_9MAGN|nr:coiled-coil domain-containing protein SCD2 [Cinnamomum micranthum f. kanehirae]
MDRVRTRSPAYVSQNSISSSSGASPIMSPVLRQARTGSSGGTNFRRAQNNAAKAAAQRLARVMSHQSPDDEDEDDDNEIMVSYSATSAGAGTRAGRPARSPSPKAPARSPSPALGRNSIEHTASIRMTSAAKLSVAAKPTSIVPPSKPFIRTQTIVASPEPPTENERERRFSPSIDVGNVNGRETGYHPSTASTSSLQDELDMLQEENESMLEKLRLAEERCEETENRARQLEKQAALKAAAEATRNEEVATLRMEIESARNEAAFALDRLQETDLEIKSLRAMSQRMILTKEEMEEVVLKRCWLARYWKLCVQYEIAGAKLDYWSSLTPLPLEVVLSSGQKAKEEDSIGDPEERDKVLSDVNDLAGEGNIENMLLVEKGLRELALLKVEDAVAIAMTQQRRSNLDTKLQNEGQNSVEAFELSKEECEDVLFKQAWLTCFWRRAKINGLHPDIVDERLQFWINHSTRSATSQDAVEVLVKLAVERGLHELRKLGIESPLWEASH